MTRIPRPAVLVTQKLKSFQMDKQETRHLSVGSGRKTTGPRMTALSPEAAVDAISCKVRFGLEQKLQIEVGHEGWER